MLEINNLVAQKRDVCIWLGFPGGASDKAPTCQRIRSLDRENPLEEGMAAHSSILAWRIPCMEEPGRL